MIGPDDSLNEFAADNGIEAAGRLIQHEQLRLGADRADERELRALAFREMTGFLFGIEMEACEQIRLDAGVPIFPEGGQVGQRVLHGHPRIKGDQVRHIGEARFDGDFVAARIEAEHPHLAGIRAEQIQKALDGGGLARAIAAEEAVALAGAHAERESVHGIQLAVATR